MPSKREKRSPLQRIEDILENIDCVRRFIGNYDFDGFVADTRTFYAVTRALEIISEASRHLPDEVKDRSAHVDWRGIAAAGNVYRHSYDNVETVLIWDVVTRDLEPLRAAMIAELRNLGGTWESTT
jgi:uncharacterized protein with HEPN domain